MNYIDTIILMICLSNAKKFDYKILGVFFIEIMHHMVIP